MEFRNRSNRYIVKNRQGATAVARKEGREREMAHTEWDGGNAVPYNKEKKEQPERTRRQLRLPVYDMSSTRVGHTMRVP